MGKKCFLGVLYVQFHDLKASSNGFSCHIQLSSHMTASPKIGKRLCITLGSLLSRHLYYTYSRHVSIL